MEPNVKDANVEHEGYQVSGARLETLLKAPVFIIIGLAVMVWEAVNRLLRTALQQGGSLVVSRGEAGQGSSAGAQPSVKVPMMPIDNYSQLDADDVIARLESLNENELGIVRTYESDHGNRQVVLDAIERRLTRTH